MIPTALYRLATCPADYRKAHSLEDSLGLERMPMGFPTVIAENNGVCVGVIATKPDPEAIVVGRLVGEGRFVLLRLVEAYENVLQAARVRSYLVPVDLENAPLRRTIERVFEIEPFQEDAAHVWFKRALPGGGENRQVADAQLAQD